MRETSGLSGWPLSIWSGRRHYGYRGRSGLGTDVDSRVALRRELTLLLQWQLRIQTKHRTVRHSLAQEGGTPPDWRVVHHLHDDSSESGQMSLLRGSSIACQLPSVDALELSGSAQLRVIQETLANTGSPVSFCHPSSHGRFRTLRDFPDSHQ